MLTQAHSIFITTLQSTLRVFLMIVIMLMLQSNLVNSVFDYFNIDAIELCESMSENEKESESEGSDIDDFLQGIFGYGHDKFSPLSSFQYNTVKLTITELIIFTPPPEKA